MHGILHQPSRMVQQSNFVSKAGSRLLLTYTTATAAEVTHHLDEGLVGSGARQPSDAEHAVGGPVRHRDAQLVDGLGGLLELSLVLHGLLELPRVTAVELLAEELHERHDAQEGRGREVRVEGQPGLSC